MAEFDAKGVTTYEWLGVGAGGVALINSFLPWLSYGDAAFSVSISAWSIALGLLSVLLLIAAGVVVLLPHFGVQIPNVPLIWLGLAGVALLFTLLAWLTNTGFGVGPSIGVFIGLVLAAASATGAFLTFKQLPAKNTQ